jgi:hypothetical protein
LTVTAATAKRSQASFQATFFHLMNEADHNPATRVTYRMAKGNAAPVYVHNFPVQTQFPLNG